MSTPDTPAVEPGEILTMPSGDVVIGVPTIIATAKTPPIGGNGDEPSEEMA